MFYDIYPHLHKKIAVATLFLPSILFWGVSLLKDSICLGALGFFLYAAYQIFFKRRKVKSSLVILILSGFLLFYIKAYIFLCILPAFILWKFIDFNKTIEDRTLRNISKFIMGIVSILAAFLLLQQVTSGEAAQAFSLDEAGMCRPMQHRTPSSQLQDASAGRRMA